MTLARQEPLSLVLFSHTQGVDGAGRSLLDLVRGLLARGAVCNVVVPAAGLLQEHLLALGSGVLVAPPECTPWQWGIIGSPPPQDFAQAYGGLMAKVLPQVQKLAPDFIISQTIVSPWGLVCAKALKIPHALSAREYGDLDHGIALFGGFKEAVADLYLSSEIVFSVTQDVARHLFGEDPEHKVEVIYSNIEADGLYDKQPSTASVDAFFPLGVEGPVVCLAGTFIPGKGQIDLIRAAIALCEAGQGVRCLLIGAHPVDSAYVSEVRALIADSKFKGNFAVLDFTSSIYGLLRQVDVVVSCSRHEALGRTLIEASLLDKPIVYTNSGGWKEVFEDGVHGLAYEVGDHHQLADRLLRTIKDPIAAGARVSAAKAYCEARFNSENYAGKVHSKLKAYVRALDGAQAGRAVNVLERIRLESVKELASKREAVASQLQTTQVALESAQQLAFERAAGMDKLQAGVDEARELAFARAAEIDKLQAGVDEAQKVITERDALIAQQASVIASRQGESQSHKKNQGKRDGEMRIAIGLAEHIGDIVACEPVARYLKLRYPGCTLVWVVNRAYRALVESNPYVDEVVTIECLTEWILISRHQKFDKIVDLHVNYRVCEHCRVPLIKQHGNPFINVYEWLNQGALLEAFSLGAGLPKLSAAPRMYLGDAQRQAVDALGLPQAFVAVHRESNDVKKDWTNEGWAALADLLDALNLPIVEVGTSKGEQASPLAGRSVDLLNRTSVLETAEVIRRARFFVGVDSGPAHLANAVQTPGIVLLGRLGWFRQYMVYTGMYASDAPFVKLVRNLQGHANELPIPDVLDAVRYVEDMLAEVGDGLPALVARYVEAPPSLPSGAVAQTFPLDSASKQELLASPLFDAAWYQLHYPHVAESGMEPVEHYLNIGGLQGCKPSAGFDSAGYLATNPDIRAAGYNPLLHFIRYGRAEDRRGGVVDEEFFPANGKLPGAIAEPRSQLSDHPAVSDALTLSPFESTAAQPIPESEFPRTYAFYLSQFHPIAENNWAHGMGFTEWNNVIQTKPLFATHDQPKVPGELGYYDLRALDVMREQVRLAQEHGITGFCFYYYYFHGKRLLYKPVENYINSDLKMPFFFLWANENWSKRWDGGDKEVIIAQQHSKEDDLAFIRGLFPIFEDERYTKINGKPILCVYKSHLFPDIVASTELWREEAVRHGFPGLYLVMVDDWIPDVIPRVFGFDASYEIPSNVIPADVLSTEADTLGLSDEFTGRIVDYEKFARFHMSRPFPEYKRFRTVMLPWDNTARYGQRAIVHINTGGDAYKLWLSQALLDTYERYPAEERIVFVHSWNEWCEGTYLEPDRRQGRRHLEETRDTIELARKTIQFQANGEHGEAFGLLRRIQREKDEGAYRLLQAARLQLMWKYKNSEKAQEEFARETARVKAELIREKEEWIDRQPMSTVLRATLRKIYRGGLRRLGLR